MKQPELKLENIRAGYGKREVLHDLNLTCTGPGLVCLLGENGSGKSTLLKVIGGLLKPESGRVSLNDEDLLAKSYGERALLSAFMPQSGIGDPAVPVYDFILMGRKPHFTWKEREEDREAVRKVIRELDLEEFAFRAAGALSGGEQQKVLLARILAQETPLLLLDEPTSNLDIRYQIEILTLLKNHVSRSRLLILTAIHDLNLAARFADFFVMMKKGSVYQTGNLGEIFTPENLRAVYGIDADVEALPAGPVVVPKV